MSEQEFMTRLGPMQALDNLGELLGEFLSSHGFIDAGRVTARIIDRASYCGWGGGEDDFDVDAAGPTVFEAGAEGAP